MKRPGSLDYLLYLLKSEGFDNLKGNISKVLTRRNNKLVILFLLTFYATERVDYEKLIRTLNNLYE